MPPWVTDAVLVALITGILGVLGGRISSRGQVQAAAVQAADHERQLMAAPYEALARRVTALEAETDRLRTQVQALASREQQWQAGWDDLRARWGRWRQQEAPPPYPAPPLAGKKEGTA